MIATSMAVDVSKVTIPAADDSYFTRDEVAKKTDEDQFFEQAAKVGRLLAQEVFRVQWRGIRCLVEYTPGVRSSWLKISRTPFRTPASWSVSKLYSNAEDARRACRGNAIVGYSLPAACAHMMTRPLSGTTDVTVLYGERASVARV